MDFLLAEETGKTFIQLYILLMDRRAWITENSQALFQCSSDLIPRLTHCRLLVVAEERKLTHRLKQSRIYS